MEEEMRQNSTDCSHLQCVKVSGQLHAPAKLAPVYMVRIICWLQCRSAVFAEELTSSAIRSANRHMQYSHPSDNKAHSASTVLT